MLMGMMLILDAVGNFLVKIPQGMWTFMAAIIAISGVLLTIKDQSRRLTLQFANDRNLKDRDREMQTRKEIFLNAAETFQTGLTCLTNYGDRELTNSNAMEDYLNKASAIAKIYVISSQTTIDCVAKALDGIAAAQLELTLTRNELDKILNSISITDYLIARDEKERDYVMEMNKVNHFNLDREQEKQDRITGMINFHRGNIAKLLDEKKSLDASASSVQVKIFKRTRELERSIWPLLISTIAAFRDELELPANVTFLQSLADRSFAKLDPLLKKILDSAE
jgi:hypothetical protein